MVRLIQGSLGRINRGWPGMAYPYEKTTIFQGDAGMEYPMMVNDEAYADTVFSRFVAAHEILHTWFPFYMGVNETRYSFMDEGWATALEYLLNQEEMGPERAIAFFQQFRVNPWAANPSPLNDLPIITPADVLYPAGWGNNAYGKAALGYLALKDLLGDAAFRRGLHAFIERWNGRHPQPWDMFNTFNDATGQNLNWFWQSWFFSGGHTDHAIERVAPRRGGYTITLGNRGRWPAPVDLEMRYTDGTTQTLHQTPAIWSSGSASAAVTLTTTKRLESVRLNGGIFVDADTTNNNWRAN
jgi:aminopeptidase N